jgi:hypothetical protein
MQATGKLQNRSEAYECDYYDRAPVVALVTLVTLVRRNLKGAPCPSFPSSPQPRTTIR